MKKIFTFNQRLMNGTVTMRSQAACFSSRELAEKARQAVIDASSTSRDDMNMCLMCDEIVEANLYEIEEDVPILNQ